MKTVYSICFICLFLFSAQFSFCQSIDSTKTDSIVIKEKRGSIFAGKPGRSMLFSLIVPGAGQIYNKSYLRVPFVWAAVGGVGWVLDYNTKAYKCRKIVYKARIDGVEPTGLPNCDKKDKLLQITDVNQLRTLRDNANVNRQQTIIIFALVWLANGVDAFVDAHLKDFDTDEDLSISFGPKWDNDPYAPMRVGLFVSLE